MEGFFYKRDMEKKNLNKCSKKELISLITRIYHSVCSIIYTSEFTGKKLNTTDEVSFEEFRLLTHFLWMYHGLIPFFKNDINIDDKKIIVDELKKMESEIERRFTIIDESLKKYIKEEQKN